MSLMQVLNEAAIRANLGTMGYSKLPLKYYGTRSQALVGLSLARIGENLNRPFKLYDMVYSAEEDQITFCIDWNVGTAPKDWYAGTFFIDGFSAKVDQQLAMTIADSVSELKKEINAMRDVRIAGLLGDYADQESISEIEVCELGSRKYLTAHQSFDFDEHVNDIEVQTRSYESWYEDNDVVRVVRYTVDTTTPHPPITDESLQLWIKDLDSIRYEYLADFVLRADLVNGEMASPVVALNTAFQNRITLNRCAKRI